ncbi:MAG: aminopeptidase [DPANN group archaeon]|nr:aminopeptidase [DPANN group archaeon]
MDIKTYLDWIAREGLLKYVKKAHPVFIHALQQSLTPKEGDTILIAGDRGTLDRRVPALVLANYIVAAKKLRLDLRFALQKPKATGSAVGEQVMEELLMLPEKSLIALSLSGKLGSSKEMGKSFRKFVSQHRHRFISTPSLSGMVTPGFKYVVSAMDIDLLSLRDRGEKLKQVLDTGEELHISTRRGTDLTVGIRGMKSINNDGIYTEPGTGGNLPAGEVYIPPAPLKVEGTIVIDGSLKDKDRCSIIRKPATFIVEKGRIVSIEGDALARKLDRDLGWAESVSRRPKNVRKIGEIGIGTNPRAKVIGPTIINEKAYGTAHVAIGSNAWFGGDIKTFVHLDQVFYEPIIQVDGKLYNPHGRYQP